MVGVAVSSSPRSLNIACCGMTASNTRQKRIEQIVNPHGIQGEMSMVADARAEATSSAIQKAENM